jgi:hypothetical protein
VFYIAEAGVVKGFFEIEGIVKQTFYDVNGDFERLSAEEKKHFDFEDEFYSRISFIEGSRPSPSFESSLGEPTSASVMVRLISENPRVYEIESIGTIGNKTRTVAQEFTINLNPTEIESPENPGVLGNMGIFTKGTITISNGTINGDIGTLKNGPNSVKATGGTVNGSIFVPSGSEKNAVNKLHWMNSFPNATGVEVGEFPVFPPFPDIPNLVFLDDKYKIVESGQRKYIIQNGNINVNSNDDGCRPVEDYTLNLYESRQFNEFKIDNNCSFIINTGNKDKEIVVNHLNLKNGHIILTGTGKLTIYVKDKITTGSGTTINNNGLTEKVNIYLKGSGDSSNPKYFELRGSQKIFGSLYAEDANITLGNGGGFHGNIFTGGKSFQVEGGVWSTSPLILAPNAKFQHTNGTITGMIVADSYEMSGGAIFNQGEFLPGGLPGSGSTGSITVGDVLVQKDSLREK